MENIEQSRRSEIFQNKSPLDIPDFLKPKNTSIRHPETPVNTQQNSNTSNNFESDTFNLDFDNPDMNLFSLDNIDKPLMIDDIVEDDLPFGDRLKRLQSERNNIVIQNDNKPIYLTHNTYISKNNIL